MIFSGVRSASASSWNIPFVGGFSFTEELKGTVLCIPQEGAKAAILFPDCPHLSLHPLLSLISNCLNLPFGIQEGSRRLNEAYFLPRRKWGSWKGF